MTSPEMAFPALLARVIRHIEADANRELEHAMSEAMEMMNIDFDDGWRADYDRRCFIKVGGVDVADAADPDSSSG